MAPAQYHIESKHTASSVSSMLLLPPRPQPSETVDIHARMDNTHETPEIDIESSDSSSGTPKPEKRPHSRARAKRIRKASSIPSTPTPILRPAKDILSRIRHDPTLDVADYLVGYHDRIEGLMEMKVEDWNKGDVTDEEFIPQHRILYFRRMSDGVRVWDRKRRLDELFGSGVPGGLPEEDGKKGMDSLKGELADAEVKNKEGEEKNDTNCEMIEGRAEDKENDAVVKETDEKHRRAEAAEVLRARLEKGC